MQTPIVFITDTTDDNARGRVTTRVQALFGVTPSFIGVTYPSQLEAAGNLIDQIDALDGHPGIIFVNVAPRSVAGERVGNRRENENGTPFCYFNCGKALIVASYDGLTLSLVKKLGLTGSVHVVDLPRAVLTLRDLGLLSDGDVDRVIRSQFRSYEALPKLGAALARGNALPGAEKSIAEVPNCPSAIWLVDGHGNCKTTLFESEVKVARDAFGDFPYYPRLKDVPDGVTALITGSSGIGAHRFVEIVTQGGSAAERLDITSKAVLV
jgi:hypothetical protein